MKKSPIWWTVVHGYISHCHLNVCIVPDSAFLEVLWLVKRQQPVINLRRYWKYWNLFFPYTAQRNFRNTGHVTSLIKAQPLEQRCRVCGMRSSLLLELTSIKFILCFQGLPRILSAWRHQNPRAYWKEEVSTSLQVSTDTIAWICR